MEGKQKECRLCHRILVEKSKLGLCPRCRADLKMKLGVLGGLVAMIGINICIDKNKDKS
ncbi:MAG: hypothetical protein MR399_10975 [Clostridiales bacterium]|nr:hypothetical protein [Clostridiales bacterium]